MGVSPGADTIAITAGLTGEYRCGVAVLSGPVCHLNVQVWSKLADPSAVAA